MFKRLYKDESSEHAAEMRGSVFVRKISVILTIFCALFILIAACSLSPVLSEPAEAYSGMVTITSDGDAYFIESEEFDDLQSALDAATEGNTSPTVVFSNLVTSSVLRLKNPATLQGDITFIGLTNQNYGLCIEANCTISGLNVRSNRGCIRVETYAEVLFLNGNCTTTNDGQIANSVAVVRSFGTFNLKDGTITYDKGATAFGYGFIGDGESIIEGGRIEGFSGLQSNNGKTTIAGGEIVANRSAGTGISDAGYSVVTNSGILEMTGGTFVGNLRQSNASDSRIEGGELPGAVITANAHEIDLFGTIIESAEHVELVVTFEGDDATISAPATNGYRPNSWKFDDNIIPSRESQSYTKGNVGRISVSDDDLYRIEYYVRGEKYGEESYRYNTNVAVDELLKPEKVGYEFSEYAELKSDRFFILEDMVLHAEIVLAKPQIADLDEVSFAYDGDEHAFKPEVTHALDVTFGYSWVRRGATETVSDKQALTLTNVADSGKYTLTVTATYGEDVSSASREFEFTVNKGVPVPSEIPSFNGVYSENGRLSNFDLPSGFRWVTPPEKPVVNRREYDAVYNPDPANYDDLSLKITIALEKANYTVKIFTEEITGVYDPNKTLADYPLPENWFWLDETEAPVCAKTRYKGFYNDDPDNYNNYITDIPFALDKATWGDDKKLPDEELPYPADLNDVLALLMSKYGNKYSINRPYPEIRFGENILSVTYSDQRENYEDLDFNWKVTVVKSPSPNPGDLVLYGTYYYDKDRKLSDIILPENYRWVDGNIVPRVSVTAYSAYYNADSEHYSDIIVTVILRLEKGNYISVDIPTLEAVTYSPHGKLADITLPQYYFWKEPETIPTVNVGTYAAIYIDDEENFNAAEIDIPLTVNKAAVPLVKMPDTVVVYDGEKHTIVAENVLYPITVVGYEGYGINAGGYEIYALIEQSDKENYTLHPVRVKGVLTIKKAPSVISAKTRYDYLVGTEPPTVSGTVENSEQSLIIPEFNETEVGIYEITLTTAESLNYLAGSLKVVISINTSAKFIGKTAYEKGYDGSYFYGIAESLEEGGLPNDLEITFEKVDSENTAVKITITQNGEEYVGRLKIRILLPDKIKRGRNLKLYMGGEEIPFTVENGYAAFDMSGSGTVEFSFDKQSLWWISLVVCIPVLGGAVAVIILFKKGKLRFGGKKSGNDVVTENNSESEITEAENEKNGD